MKKLIVKILLIISIFTFISVDISAYNNLWSNWSDKCSNYDFENQSASVWDALDKCLSNAELVNGSDVTLTSGFWEQIKMWTKNISVYLWVFAVLSIVIWALMLTLSAWEEEKIKKGKDIVKWGMIWFFWIVSAAGIINLIIKMVYSV